MQKVILDVEISLKGPLLTQDSSPGELGLDMVVARHNDEEKTPYLPGTLIAGKLRQALEELDSLTGEDRPDWFKPKLSQWLGERSKNDFPKRKQLYISDFNLTSDSMGNLDDSLIRDRTTVNDDTGAVEEHHILMMENPFVSGENYSFSGEIHFFAPKDTVNSILKHLKTGFNWFTHLGAMKSTGFGQIEHVEFLKEDKLDIQLSVNTTTQQSKKIGLVITPKFPFCLSGRPVSNNLFESESIISGNAIIGTIANTLSHLCGQHNGRLPDKEARFTELLENFSKLRITHAFPTNNKQRPVVAPLSLVKINTDQFYDVAQLQYPVLINKEPPDFALDWKDTADTLKEYPWPYIRFKDWGWASLNSELRVRTKIDRKNYRSAEGELFAYEQILPDDTQWLAELDASRIEEADIRNKVISQLQSLLEHGAIGLGKTKTVIDIKFDNEIIKPELSSSIEPINDHTWVITLQTDTLLGSPEKLNETSGKKELEAMYKQCWKELSEGKLKLVRYFARQRLSGGDYQKTIFMKGDVYKPWLLTEAGSVFVLQAENNNLEAVQTLIETWLTQGLPLSQMTRDYYQIHKNKEDWEQCPFIPQNGYGEIVVNPNLESKNIKVLNNKSDIIIQINPIPEEQEV